MSWSRGRRHLLPQNVAPKHGNSGQPHTYQCSSVAPDITSSEPGSRTLLITGRELSATCCSMNVLGPPRDTVAMHLHRHMAQGRARNTVRAAALHAQPCHYHELMRSCAKPPWHVQ